MNDVPIVLKREDSPAPADPQTAAIEHQAALRALAEEARHLVSVLTRWGDDPVTVFRRAQALAVEISEQASRVEQSGESLHQSYRLSGLFSNDYTDLGVR